MAYDNTQVPVDRSQAQIRSLLAKHGAQRFSFHEGVGDVDKRQWVALEFVHAADFERPTLIRLAVPLKMPDAKELADKARRAYSKTLGDITREAQEKETRRIWRVIFYSLKSRLEAVEEQVETFEQAFLPHIVDPVTGGTVWDMLKKPIEDGRMAIGGRGMALPAKASS